MKRHWPTACLAILILVSTVLAASCRSNSTADTNEISQKYLFEVHYINWAWGYQDNGTCIDRDRNVYRFDLSNRDPKFQYPEDDRYSQALLDDMYSGSVLIGTIDRETMARMSPLIAPASRGQLTEREHTACDAGGQMFKAFLFDAEAGVYTSVPLRQCGDWSTENTAPEAATLFEWLKQTNGGTLC